MTCHHEFEKGVEGCASSQLLGSWDWTFMWIRYGKRDGLPVQLAQFAQSGASLLRFASHRGDGLVLLFSFVRLVVGVALWLVCLVFRNLPIIRNSMRLECSPARA